MAISCSVKLNNNINKKNINHISQDGRDQAIHASPSSAKFRPDQSQKVGRIFLEQVPYELDSIIKYNLSIYIHKNKVKVTSSEQV